MELVPANVALSFEVTFDSPILDVAMSVYNTTGGSPQLVQGPTAMSLLVGNTYFGKFNPDVNKSYVIVKAVYTDETFTTMSPNYSQGSESIYAQDVGGGGGGGGGGSPEIVGYIDSNNEIVGIVEC
jgi:hypothetical protein